MNEKKKSVKTEVKLEMTQLSLPITQTDEAKEMAVESATTTDSGALMTGTAANAAVDTGKDFEEALLELEKVVAQLEGEVKLEEALQLFDRGMKLSKSCDGILKNAEKKIEILKRAVDGTLTTDTFNEDSLQNS